LTFWHNYLAANINNSFKVGQFIGFVINGATGTDATILTNKVTVAAFNTQEFAAAGITHFDSSTPAGQASISAIASVTDTAASVAAAQAQITAFAKNGGATNVFLTTGVDNATQGFSSSASGTPLLNGFTAILNNTTFNGTVGGGATFTAGDQIIAAAGTTGQIFNLGGTPATHGVIDVTAVAGAMVSGIQTANLTSSVDTAGFPFQAFKGDFSATGPQGDWGLTTLNVLSGGNTAGADNVTVGNTAVNITDTLFDNTTGLAPLTVNGGSVVTISEDNNFERNGGIAVNGGSATTSVSITQHEQNTSNDGFVVITDAGFATKSAGTIATVLLDGISSGQAGHPHNVINDNALATLTVAHSDLGDAGNNLGHFIPGGLPLASDIPTQVGALLDINNNQPGTTATTLALTLTADGINNKALPDHALLITDTNNEISTIHLSLGNQNSFADILDNGLATLDTPNAGTGGLVGFFQDLFVGAVNLDFSGLNGPNDIEVNRGSSVNNDVFTLGNFGTDATTTSTNDATQQELTILNINNNNTDSIFFGSGAYEIEDAKHDNTKNPHHYINTAPDGAGLISGFPALEQWAHIQFARADKTFGDTLQFQPDTIQVTFNDGNFGSVANGIKDALTHGPHSATVFTVANTDTYVFDHAGTSSLAVSPNDSLVEFVGITFNNAFTSPGGIVHLA
jgi:hypothetical protein